MFNGIIVGISRHQGQTPDVATRKAHDTPTIGWCLRTGHGCGDTCQRTVEMEERVDRDICQDNGQNIRATVGGHGARQVHDTRGSGGVRTGGSHSHQQGRRQQGAISSCDGKRQRQIQKTLSQSEDGAGGLQDEGPRVLLLCQETHQGREGQNHETAGQEVRSDHTQTHLVGGEETATPQQVGDPAVRELPGPIHAVQGTATEPEISSRGTPFQDQCKLEPQHREEQCTGSDHAIGRHRDKGSYQQNDKKARGTRPLPQSHDILLESRQLHTMAR